MIGPWKGPLIAALASRESSPYLTVRGSILTVYRSYGSIFYAAERFWTSTEDGRGYNRLDLPEQPWAESEHSFSSGIGTPSSPCCKSLL